MSNVSESKPKTPWHVRLGQIFIAACIAAGLKAAQKKEVPPLGPSPFVMPMTMPAVRPAPEISLNPPTSARPNLLLNHAPHPSDVS